MELHPFLEPDTLPATNLWYVVSSQGDSPTTRVGHEMITLKTDDDGRKIYIIGGANPSECFNDTYILDTKSLTWDTLDATGLRARYEHVAFVPESQPDQIYVFGGADISGNMNDVMTLNTTKSDMWTTVQVSGTVPVARTHHTGAVVGDRLVIYSGGQSGVDPVGDRQVHCFDASTSSWTVLDIHGESPKPRHGHIMAAVNNTVFLHGGMAGTTFYDDLHTLDLDKKKWVLVKKKGVRPSARAAHGSAVCDTWVYVFGGMNRDGALDDFFRLDTNSLAWTQIKFDGPPPPARLDFAMCIVKITRDDSTPNGDTEEVLATSAKVKDVITNDGTAASGGASGLTVDTGAASNEGLVDLIAASDKVGDVITNEAIVVGGGVKADGGELESTNKGIVDLIEASAKVEYVMTNEKSAGGAVEGGAILDAAELTDINEGSGPPQVSN